MSNAGSSVLMSLGSSVAERSSEKRAEKKPGAESGSSSARGGRSPQRGFAAAGRGQGPKSAREAQDSFRVSQQRQHTLRNDTTVTPEHSGVHFVLCVCSVLLLLRGAEAGSCGD
eukprot:700821-Amphidinium_carterae.1